MGGNDDNFQYNFKIVQWGVWERKLENLSDILVNASYRDHQEYEWFMGVDLDHFQDNLQMV